MGKSISTSKKIENASSLLVFDIWWASNFSATSPEKQQLFLAGLLEKVHFWAYQLWDCHRIFKQNLLVNIAEAKWLNTHLCFLSTNNIHHKSTYYRNRPWLLRVVPQQIPVLSGSRWFWHGLYPRRLTERTPASSAPPQPAYLIYTTRKQSHHCRVLHTCHK